MATKIGGHWNVWCLAVRVFLLGDIFMDSGHWNVSHLAVRMLPPDNNYKIIDSWSIWRLAACGGRQAVCSTILLATLNDNVEDKGYSFGNVVSSTLL